MERVIHRVWQRAQSENCRSQEEYELATITLRFLGLIRRGEAATLDGACFEAFGCAFHIWKQRNLGRQAAMAWELAALVPDYDPSVESESRLRRQTEGRRPVLPLSEPPRPGIKESVLQMPLPRTGTK
jgi:hypothetical protein